MKTHMVATIDIGNSHPHIGIFEDHQLKDVLSLDEFLKIYKSPVSNITPVVCSVSKTTKLPTFCEKIIYPKKFLKNNLFFRMPVQYEETIGIDRLIQSYYLFENQIHKKMDPDKILLLDIGTFLTADFITAQGLQGGYIFPGEQSFLNAYHANGDLLPQLQKKDKKLNPLCDHKIKDPPHSTQMAIYDSLPLYFEGLYKELNQNYHPNLVFITGGDGQRHEKIVRKVFNESSISINKNLIHYSMHFLAKQLKKI